MRTLLAAAAALAACAPAFAGSCEAQVREARAANEKLRNEVFATHPPHPRGAMALAELKRSDQLLDSACRKGSDGHDFVAAGFAHRQARDRLAGRLPASM